MATTNNFKSGLDLSPWKAMSQLLVSDANGASFAWDMRNDTSRLPLIYKVTGTATFSYYSTYSNGWIALLTPALAPGFAAGATAIMHPSQGPRGTISAATSTTSFTLSSLATAGGAAVGINQLADRGDGVGHQIRIVDNATAASGKTEIVTITKNTSGATPVVTVSPALTFTPTVNSAYEILSGRVWLLASGAIGANTWKYYDVATNSYTTRSQTNLIATVATDSSLIAMSELYVSSDRKPNDGFLDNGSTYGNGLSKCIVASASASTTITTGAALTNPSSPSLSTNEYRNFQVRIVEDTGTPTAVGQRRNITSHTSGTQPVFTVPSWTTTPSATAKFVVEQNDDHIICRTSASTNLYCYTISTNAWDASTTFAAGGTGNGAGVMMEMCFGLVRDATGNRLQGQIFVFAAGATSTLDMFDITAGATGVWTAGVTYGNSGPTFTGATSAGYDPVTMGGKYLYITTINAISAQAFYRFNMLTQTLEPWQSLSASSPTTTVTGAKVAFGYMIDGTTNIGSVYTCLIGDQKFGFYSAAILN